MMPKKKFLVYEKIRGTNRFAFKAKTSEKNAKMIRKTFGSKNIKIIRHKKRSRMFSASIYD